MPRPRTRRHLLALRLGLILLAYAGTTRGDLTAMLAAYEKNHWRAAWRTFRNFGRPRAVSGGAQ